MKILVICSPAGEASCRPVKSLQASVTHEVTCCFFAPAWEELQVEGKTHGSTSAGGLCISKKIIHLLFHQNISNTNIDLV